MPAYPLRVAQGATSLSWPPSWPLPSQEVGVRTVSPISPDLTAGVGLPLVVMMLLRGYTSPPHRAPSPEGSWHLLHGTCISGTNGSAFWRWPELLAALSFPTGTKILFCFVSV